MSGDTCVMPDGNCTGCNHCDHDEMICVASEDFKKTCSNATEDNSVDIMCGGDEFILIASEQLDFCSPKCLCSWTRKHHEAKS